MHAHVFRERAIAFPNLATPLQKAQSGKLQICMQAALELNLSIRLEWPNCRKYRITPWLASIIFGE